MIGKLPRPKRGFVLPSHKYTGPYNPLHKQLDEFDRPVPGQEPYNAVDAISMRHDICYRDKGQTKEGKHACDDEMLKELDVLHPKGIREKIDKKLVRAIIGKKRKSGLGIDDDDGVQLLTSELADELHKPLRRKFPKRRVFADGVDAIWAADLVDMQKLSRANKGYRHILMIIDIFSKFGWAIPLKNKSGPEVVRAFRGLFKTQTPPKKLWTDKGSEFKYAGTRKLLREHGVHLYMTENEEKSCVVERWNRTIKRDMWKYFTARRTSTYIDVLQKLIDKYNNTYHRSIKCTPSFARQPSSYQHVYQALYDRILVKKKRPTTPRFKVGDYVRMSIRKGQFEKGYTINWTKAVYTVNSVKDTTPVTYTLKDLRGDVVAGTFYEQELQKTKQQVYRVEKVLRKRTRNGRKEIYVKWDGYDKSFNSWESAAIFHNER